MLHHCATRHQASHRNEQQEPVSHWDLIMVGQDD